MLNYKRQCVNLVRMFFGAVLRCMISPDACRPRWVTEDNYQLTLLTLSSTEDFSSNNLTYMDVYLLLTKTLKQDCFHREKEN